MDIDDFDKFRELYPQLSDDELREARDNFDRYVELVGRIYDRILKDPVEYAKFKRLLEKRKGRAAGK